METDRELEHPARPRMTDSRAGTNKKSLRFFIGEYWCAQHAASKIDANRSVTGQLNRSEPEKFELRQVPAIDPRQARKPQPQRPTTNNPNDKLRHPLSRQHFKPLQKLRFDFNDSAFAITLDYIVRLIQRHTGKNPRVPDSFELRCKIPITVSFQG